MKARSTKPFNAMGVIAPISGMIIDTKSAVTIAQLENMGFVERIEDESNAESKAEVKKKAKK